MRISKKSGGFTKSWSFSKNQADLQNLGAFPKMRRIYKILALFQKSGRFKILALFRKPGGFEKYWRFSENQADLKNIGALTKIRRIYKMLASRRKIGGRYNLAGR
jgi:hypothetical protein